MKPTPICISHRGSKSIKAGHTGHALRLSGEVQAHLILCIDSGIFRNTRP